MRRPLLAAAAAVALAMPATAGAQTPAPTVLNGSVGVIGIQLPLTRNGIQVETLPTGSYRLNIVDQTNGHSFHIVGPGVDEGTPILGGGSFTWDVEFTHARYNWFCDVHPTAMYGTVTVGNFLVIEPEGFGSITSSPTGISCLPFCEASFPSGGTVDLTPTAPPGFRFKGWQEGPCSGDGPCSVEVNGTVFLRARFERDPAVPPPDPPPPPPPVSEVAPARIVEAKVVRTAGKRVLVVRLAVRRDAEARFQLRSGQRLYVTKRVQLLPGRRTVRLAVPRSVSPGPYGLHVRLEEFLSGASYTLKKTVRIPKLRPVA
jgi:hypothetical protein